MDKRVLPNDVLLGEVSELLDEGRDVIIPTKGNSMLPFIKGERDSVKLRRIEDFVVGDIALAETRKGVYVLHRIFAIDGDIVTLMGDGNLRGREICRRGNVVGVVMSILKDDGREVDSRSPKAFRRARIWRRLLPFRRIILGIYRRICL